MEKEFENGVPDNDFDFDDDFYDDIAEAGHVMADMEEDLGENVSGYVNGKAGSHADGNAGSHADGNAGSHADGNAGSYAGGNAGSYAGGNAGSYAGGNAGNNAGSYAGGNAGNNSGFGPSDDDTYNRTSTVKTVMLAALFLIMAALSMTVLARMYNDSGVATSIVQSLSEKKSSVAKLSATSAAASTAITMLPGDIGTPIAENLADLSSNFLIIFCAIYIEKFLVAVSGFLALDILVPLGFVAFAINLFWRHQAIKTAGVRLISMGLVILLLIPSSVTLSNIIEKQYHDEIVTTMSDAEQSSQAIQNVAEETEDENDSLWSQFINSISGGLTGLTDKLQTVLSNFVDAIAIYIVTTCVIPLLVMFLLIWALRVIFSISTKPWIPGMHRPHEGRFSRRFTGSYGGRRNSL